MKGWEAGRYGENLSYQESVFLSVDEPIQGETHRTCVSGIMVHGSALIPTLEAYKTPTLKIL